MSYIFLAPAPPLEFSVFPPSATRTPPCRRSRRRRHRHRTALAARAHCATCSPPPRRHRLHPRTFRAAVACTCTPARHRASAFCAAHAPLRHPRATAAHAPLRRPHALHLHRAAAHAPCTTLAHPRLARQVFGVLPEPFRST
jgi:hypothetical protein